ncbi:hypothetical protein LOTGIDRAFT_161870 [Lottia gigantea]|uniref:Prokineticin domain-containing protein n=1 Tax=Lottia gigantea TaxID=225164 RepID=V4BW67_LOTGI|nr:hypothetical protein LOTGIDRAFT_161870 [Lottia gigantea]ESO93304.1 hypothetical protein LOTGIDRAFT_161870 [Lottia gigantea]
MWLSKDKAIESNINGELLTEHGDLIDYVDKCNPKHHNSCGGDKCCLKESLTYTPETAVGPMPRYRISCQPRGVKGKPCFVHKDSVEVCPCAKNMFCVPGVLHYLGTCYPK